MRWPGSLQRMVEQSRYAERKRGRGLGSHRAGGVVGRWGDFEWGWAAGRRSCGPMKNTPDSLSSFIRFIQLNSVRPRTQEEYLRWVRQLAAHTGVACASLATQKEVLTFLHWLQQTKGYAGSTLNQAVCGLRMFFRDHLGHTDSCGDGACTSCPKD